MANSYDDIQVVDDEKLADPGEYLADIPARLVSGVLGLMAFMLACVVGLFAGNPGYVILVRAMIAMVVCAIIGRILGMVGEVCVREYVLRYKSDRPRPQKPTQLVELERAKRAHEQVVARMKNAA